MQSLEREIAALKVEVEMVESHAHKLINAASELTDSDEQHNLLLLATEESEKAASIRQEIQILKVRLYEGTTPAA